MSLEDATTIINLLKIENLREIQARQAADPNALPSSEDVFKCTDRAKERLNAESVGDTFIITETGNTPLSDEAIQQKVAHQIQKETIINRDNSNIANDSQFSDAMKILDLCQDARAALSFPQEKALQVYRLNQSFEKNYYKTKITGNN